MRFFSHPQISWKDHIQLYIKIRIFHVEQVLNKYWYITYVKVTMSKYVPNLGHSY